MATDTNISLRNAVIYSMFIRNHTQAGTLVAAQADLPRIKALGTTIIWLMPIQPSGKAQHKGTLGSPYAILDYRKIDPALGDFSDLKNFVTACHQLGMKVILDVVYNHTSPDSVLAKTHPDWFYKTSTGKMGNRIADWSDVIDLDYGHEDLWHYQIQTLVMWLDYVDGFRCDVAPLVPLAFWKKARAIINAIKPGTIWLSETIEPAFLKQVRDMGYNALSDSEIYQAFDMTYEYDVLGDFKAALKQKISLAEYARLLNRMDVTYPKNYVKMRFLENHDNPRAAAYIQNSKTLRNALAFKFFEKGSFLMYAGEEFSAVHLPSLFDRDVIDLQMPDQSLNLSALITRLSVLKQAKLMATGKYAVKALNASVLQVSYQTQKYTRTGIFALMPFSGKVTPDLSDGDYTDLLHETEVTVTQGELDFTGEPLILTLKA